MYAFNLATNQEIVAPQKKQSGTDRILTYILKNFSRTVKDFQLGKDTPSSRGSVDCKQFPSDLTFENCKFNGVTFLYLNKTTFKNCVFKRCIFCSSKDVAFEDCNLNDYIFKNIDQNGVLSGKCTFIRSSGYGRIDYGLIERVICNICNLTVVNCKGNLGNLEATISKERERIERLREEQKELRKRFKYGYKIVNTPVLVKLSFPDDAEIVNLNKDKSRASKAFVEKVTILNNFEGEGVTNTDFDNNTEYRVGELVYPDSFDSNPNENCGHGIHFCKDWRKVNLYNSLATVESHALEKLMKNEED